MSAHRGSGNSSSGQGQARDKLFNPAIDVEQAVLGWINNIGNSAIFVATVGDAKQANVVFTMGVLNLDSFVFAMLTSDDTKDWSEYIEKRSKIISNWPQDPIDQGSRARQLYELTIATWNGQRLFKVRRYSYYGERWKKAVKLDIAKMQEEEEKEQVESDEG